MIYFFIVFFVLFGLCVYRFAIYWNNDFSFYTKEELFNSNENKKEKKYLSNVCVMKKLGYYNYNTNTEKSKYLFYTMCAILFGENPNYIFANKFIKKSKPKNWSFYKTKEKFNIMLKDLNMSLEEITVGELFSYIKNTPEYKKLESTHNYKLARTIKLSKYLLDDKTENLYSQLTDKEKLLLNVK